MALRLNEHILYGEIDNTRHYAVYGWFALRGSRRPVRLQLTGDCGADLKGRRIRFEVPGLDDDPELADEGLGEGPFFGRKSDSPPDSIDELGIHTQQIGPTGEMTAARRVKVSDCPAEELYMRTKLGEPPPFEWKRLLYLEWFSQNGRVVLELPDPVIEVVEEDEAAAESAAGEASESPADDPPHEDDAAPSGGLEITAIHLDEDGNASIEDLTPENSEEDEEREEDPFGVVSDDLQRQFDASASRTDWEILPDEEKSDPVHEMELMDNLIENGPGERIDSIFDVPFKLPPPDAVDDAAAEDALKVLLGQMALFGIAIEVCEHFTPRDTYRLLIEEICKEDCVYPELRDTQWVQHFGTSEYCEKCLAEYGLGEVDDETPEE